MNRLALVLCLVVLVASCGDDDGGGDDGGPRSVDVLLDDFEFSPGTVGVTAGEEVVVEVSNLGGVQHSWALISAGPEMTTAVDLDPSRILASTGEVEPGDTGRVTFNAPEPGTYRVICVVPGHVEVGMTGTLEVTG